MGGNQREIVQYSIDAIVSSMGSIQIQELARQTGYSPRYIYTLFDQHTGLSPKTFEKIIRFQHAVYLINHYQEERLTNVGAQVGYYDQAHFIREFKSHISMTPVEYSRLVRQHSYLQRMSIDSIIL